MNAYQLAGYAGTASPDGPDSPGAEWLERIATDAADLIDWHPGENPDELADEIHERADQIVPIYTHERWQVFVDLAAYQEDPTELGATADDLTHAAGVALYLIAERLYTALVWLAVDETEEVAR